MNVSTDGCFVSFKKKTYVAICTNVKTFTIQAVNILNIVVIAETNGRILESFPTLILYHFQSADHFHNNFDVAAWTIHTKTLNRRKLRIQHIK